MNKSDVADTINREIAYRLELIDQCKNGFILAEEPDDFKHTYIAAQFAKIDECKWLAGKLHIKL